MELRGTGADAANGAGGHYHGRQRRLLQAAAMAATSDNEYCYKRARGCSHFLVRLMHFISFFFLSSKFLEGF
jgi:hypothetical protein